MPIPQAKAPLNLPSALVSSSGANQSNGSRQRSWWTVYTRTRGQKSLARQLSWCRIPCYLPLAPREHDFRGRSVILHLPLFDRFLFLFCNQDECLTALSTRLISRILPVGDQERLRQDLWNLQRLIDAETSLTVETHLAPGAKVRIPSGPLGGVEGILTQRSGRNRFLVAVAEIGQGVSLPIDDLGLERTHSLIAAE